MKTKEILKACLAVLGLLAAVYMALNPDVIGIAGMSLAFAGVVGTPVMETVRGRNVSTVNVHILRPEVVKKITQIRPSSTPLDTVLQNISGKRSAKSFRVRYYSAGVRDIQTTVKTKVSATTESNSPLTKTHVVQLDNIDFADDNDVLMFHEITEGTEDGLALVGLVIERQDDGNVKVMMLNGTGTNHRDTPEIPVGTHVSRIGSAMNELDARCNDFSLIPTNEENYMQIIMSTLSQGLYEKMGKEGIDFDFDLNDLKDQAIYDFRRKREAACLFGVKAISYKDGRKIYTTQGIASTIEKHKKFLFKDTDKVEDVIMDWIDFIFNGNNGSDTRYAFFGPEILNWMAKGTDVQKWLDEKSTETVFGLRFSKIETLYGTLFCRFHQDFINHGWGNKALVIDPEYIDLYNLRPLGVRTMDDPKNGPYSVIEEALCPVVTNLDCHAVLEMSEGQ